MHIKVCRRKVCLKEEAEPGRGGVPDRERILAKFPDLS